MRHWTTALCIVTILVSLCGLSDAAPPAVRTVSATQAAKTKIPTISLSGAEFLQVLEKLAGTARVRMQVDWRSLKAAGVEPKSKVTVAGENLTLAQLLDLTLTKIEGVRQPLGWYISGKQIIITTQSAILGRPSGPAVFKITDPKAAPPAAAAPPRPRRPRGTRLDFEDVPARDVVDFFRETFKLNIVAHWNSLEAVGVTKETPVTLKITQPVPLARGLDLFVDSFSTGSDPLQRVYWLLEGGVYTITTGAVLDSRLSSRVMDVSDMLMVTPNFVGPRLSIQRNTASGGDSSSSGSNASSGFGQSSSAGSTGQSTLGGGNVATDTNQQRALREQTLMAIVRNSIGEEFWQPTGRGTIRIIKGKMIITQSKLGFLLMDRSLNGGLR